MKPRCPCSRPSVLLSRASRNNEGFAKVALSLSFSQGRLLLSLPGTPSKQVLFPGPDPLTS